MSLILAQSERQQYALHMRVERFFRGERVRKYRTLPFSLRIKRIQFFEIKLEIIYVNTKSKDYNKQLLEDNSVEDQVVGNLKAYQACDLQLV